MRACLKLGQAHGWDPKQLGGRNIFEDQIGTLQELVYLGEGGGETGWLAVSLSRTPQAVSLYSVVISAILTSH